MDTPGEVIVIGGGIGGLCLAHGLRTAGIPVEVYERDEHPGSRWEGYRIHIDAAGARSLRACLPERLWRAFLATSGPPGDFGFITTGLAELLVVEDAISYPDRTDPAAQHYAVDRRTLRRLLLADLGDAVTFGAEFARYEDTPDGQVAAVFADGRRAVCDVLVGADGAGSRVRRQYLPHAEPVAAGVGGVAHKLYLTEQTRGWVPAPLQRGMNVVSGHGPASLFTSVYAPPPAARAELERATGREAPPGIDDPYLLCALNANPALLPGDLLALDTDALRALVAGLSADWHPTLRRVLAESDPESRSGVLFSASPRIPAWPSSRVTVLGDAIHTMPPTGGNGGNAALRDAHRLAKALRSVAHGDQDLLPAVAAYEADMREHGYAAVREALKTRDQLITGALSTRAGRAWFRLCRRSTALRRRSFATQPGALSEPRQWELAAVP